MLAIRLMPGLCTRSTGAVCSGPAMMLRQRTPGNDWHRRSVQSDIDFRESSRHSPRTNFKIAAPRLSPGLADRCVSQSPFTLFHRDTRRHGIDSSSCIGQD
jgi:hypothetical protein